MTIANTQHADADAGNAIDVADKALAKGIDAAMRSKDAEAGATQSIVQGIIAKLNASNGNEFTVHVDGKDVPFNATSIVQYARGAYPAKATKEAPDVLAQSHFLAALCKGSERYAAQREAYDKAAGFLKKGKGSDQQLRKKANERDHARLQLEAVKKPIKDAMRIVAFAMTAVRIDDDGNETDEPMLDWTNVTFDKRVAQFPIIGADEDEDNLQRVPIAEANKAFAKPRSTKANPPASTTDTGGNEGATVEQALNEAGTAPVAIMRTQIARMVASLAASLEPLERGDIDAETKRLLVKLSGEIDGLVTEAEVEAVRAEEAGAA